MLEDRVGPDVDTAPTTAFKALGDSARKGVALELGRSAVALGDFGLCGGVQGASDTKLNGSSDVRRTGSSTPR